VDGASAADLASDLLFHPDRVTRERFATVEAHALAAEAERQQVLPLLLAAVRQRGWEAGVLQHRARVWTLHEALERDAVRGVLDELHRAGVRSLFFKGAALAFGVYGDPRDRMRADWDLLVAGEDFAVTGGVLRARGFVKDLKTPRGIRNRQQTYRRAVSSGECAIDLHSGVVNAPALADRIRFEDLFARSIPLTGLHGDARGTDDIDSLVVACLHRVAHHSGELRLIWDHDIRLLADRVDSAGAGALLARAAEWRVGPLVAAEIARVMQPAPAWIEALAAQPSDVIDLGRPNRSRGDDFLIDWRALGWRGRAALLRETLLPAAAYMRESSGSSLPLPVLYVRRAVRGVGAWLRRPRRTNRPA
jgi:hypothetical protein